MLETQLFDFIIPIGLLAVLLGVLFYQRRRAVPAGDVRPMALFLGVPAASLIYWFCTAPHPRFAAGAPWVFIAGLGAFVLARFVPARARLARGLTAALMLVSFCGLRGFIPLTLPGSDRGFHPAPQVKDAFDYTTDHGLVIHTVPTGVYQTWQMPLPNTPYPKRKLRLRRPGDLQSGFIIDGPLTEKTS